MSALSRKRPLILLVLLLVAISYLVLRPAPDRGANSIPTFSGIKPRLTLLDGTTAGLEVADTTSSLSSEEHAACDRAGNRQRSMQEERRISGFSDVDPETEMYELQTRPGGFDALWSAGGRLVCYAGTRPDRLCQQGDRVQLVAEALAFAAAFDKTLKQIKAVEGQRLQLTALAMLRLGPVEGTKIMNGVYSGFRAALEEQRAAVVASLQQAAAYMPPAAYQAANAGMPLPSSLGDMLAAVTSLDDSCAA